MKIDSTAIVKTNKIGKNTIVWQFSIILDNAEIGSNCNINSHCFIENEVKIGDNVTIKCGNYIWDNIEIEDNVFIGPNVNFTNDKYPRSKIYPDKFFKTIIKKGASIGAGSIIMPGVIIGKFCMIGAGSLIVKDVPDYTLFLGNPAEFSAYVCQCGRKLDEEMTCSLCGKSYKIEGSEVICIDD